MSQWNWTPKHVLKLDAEPYHNRTMTKKPETISIPQRCQNEKGRNLCLFSSIEYKTKSAKNVKTAETGETAFSLNYMHAINEDQIKRKYYTNMYALSKWSEFIRELYLNDTLDKFCNKMDDGTYILGVPASSKSIESVVLAVSQETDAVINPYQGSVQWVRFSNVMDAMDIANFLQIEDILVKCFAVIYQTFPGKVGSTDASTFKCSLDVNDRSYNYSYYSRNWNVGIPAVLKLNEKESNVMAIHLMVLISYLEHRSFDWSKKTKIKTKSMIEPILLAFLSIDVKFVSINQKIALFKKYIKNGDYAQTLFYQLTFMTFGKNAPKTLMTFGPLDVKKNNGLFSFQAIGVPPLYQMIE